MSLFGSDASDTVQQALENLQEINVPTPESMQITLQKLVQAGVLTPEQAETALVNGNAYDKTSSDNSGMSAELQALGNLGNIVNSGGSDAIESADIADLINKVNTQERGANQAVLQSQAARGALTSGETLAAQLANNATGSANATTGALTSNAAAEQRALQALSMLGSQGSAVQGQQYGAEASKANAANEIAKFNASQKQSTDLFNTQAKNTAAAANLANAQDISNTNINNANANAERNANLIEQDYQNKLQKATGTANQTNVLAQAQQNQSNQNGQLTGGILGTAGSVIGGIYGGAGGAAAGKQIGQTAGNEMATAWTGGEIENFKQGGPVPGRAAIPGDSPKNDTVQARLSPGEVVLPRSVVQAGDPNSVMAFLHRMRRPEAPKTPHPHDVATVLHALGKVRQDQGGAL